MKRGREKGKKYERKRRGMGKEERGKKKRKWEVK
jgi:hypothetical protein